MDGRERRLKAKELMEVEGGVKESVLMEQCELKDKKALNRLFAQLRIGEVYPIKTIDEEGENSYRIGTHEEWVESKKAKAKDTETSGNSKPKPKLKLEKVLVRRTKWRNRYLDKIKVLNKARKKLSSDPTNSLYQIDAQIHSLQLEKIRLQWEDWLSTTAKKLVEITEDDSWTIEKLHSAAPETLEKALT